MGHGLMPTRPNSPTRRVARRERGIVCVVAMMFLIVFIVLAVGFYAAMAMAAQISANERAVATSQLAAESGMEYMRYQMGMLDIAPTVPAARIFEEVARQLNANLTGTTTLGPRGVGYDGRSITIPDDPAGYIRLSPDGPGFRAVVSDIEPGVVKVKVVGTPGSAPSRLGRAIEVEYVTAHNPTIVFDYGVASNGKVQLKSTASTKITGDPDVSASIMSTSGGSPSVVTGGGPIDGKLAVMTAKTQVSLGGGSVGGATASADILANHVSVLPRPPEFPWVDTTVYKPFATNTYAAVSYQKNIRVPANTNPKFNAGDVIDGILYIESPNNVTFRGAATINGLIVFENAGAPTGPGNSLDFRGNVSPQAMPDTPEFAALRDLAGGLAIAAPTASVTISGSVDANVTGSVIASSVKLDGSADIFIRQGSLIARSDDPLLVEGKGVNFIGSASDNPPYRGVRLRSWFKPNPCSYREVPQ